MIEVIGLGGHVTEEDAFARRTAEEYAAKLLALWRQTPLWGAAPGHGPEDLEIRGAGAAHGAEIIASGAR